MITHIIPYSGEALDPAWHGQSGGLSKGCHGPLCLPLYAAARCEGSGIDPGTVPCGARARRLRRALLLSGARPTGARCRRQCAAQGDRDADRTLRALFGGARAVLGDALFDQRNPESRWRGQGGPDRAAEVACRHRGRSGVRGPRSQVSDLGAESFPRGTRGGHREGPRAQEAARHPGSGGRSARSAGMMTGRGGGQPAADGGLARHIPVLGGPAVEFLGVRDGGIYIDATFGAGGYTRAILAAANCNVIGIDRDQRAIAAGFGLVSQAEGRLVLVEDRFSNLEAVARACGYDAVDGVVLDVGVSSMQLDEAGRGFSFRLDGPLDMRMGGDGPSAADLVARASERDLSMIIATLGEERHARAVARAIVRSREETPIETTGALAAVVSRVVHARPGQIHPATRTFQALRIFVNEELNELAAALEAAERVLRPGGRLAVVSFHSLEDRIGKSFLTARETGRASGRARGQRSA